jgi:3-deoxy-D-manno-octulosonic-acid transferase
MILYAAIYRLAIAAYSSSLRIASLFHFKAKLFVNGRKGLLAHIKQQLASDGRQSIWMHCASLGEFEQGRPALEALKRQYPQFTVIVTFFSPSGYEVRKEYKGADHVFYLPIDTPKNAADFIDIINPALCIFVKYEFWYYYLLQIQQRNIPAVLLSAIFHKEQIFFKWYGGLLRSMLQCFTHIFVQDEASLELLNKIGVTNASVSGDTRFDRVIEVAQEKKAMPIADAFSDGYKIIVAGSTWPKDEELLHKALALLPRHWKLILVPHEVNADHIRSIENLFGVDIIKWSSLQEAESNLHVAKRVLLVDKVGFLTAIYRYGNVAWIGGGFGKAGVHNVLEAAVYGMPCFYGPIFHQFNEAVGLIESGGAFSIATPQSLAESLMQMEESERYTQHALAAREYVYENAGATAKVMAWVRGRGLGKK